MRKKVVKVILLLLTMLLAGCGQENKQESVLPVQESSVEQARQEFNTEFFIAGKGYTVTAADTLETHMVSNPWGEQSERRIYQISLKDEKGEILQQFTHDGIDEFVELYCDDLNFDGFPDLEVVSWHHENEAGGEIYLWEQAKQRFSEEGIDLPRTYKVYEEKKVFTLGSINEIICRLNENREIQELRSFTLNVEEKTLRIYDSVADKFLVNERIELDQDNQLINNEDYQEIFWSNLPGSDEKIETYFSVDTEDYNISLMDLVPGESLKLVISKGDHDVTISRVYRKEADYKSPEEFTAGTFTNLLGHNGFYIYDCFCGMWNFANYYAVEEKELICLAESWGGEPSDYMEDVDGDNDNELICNVTYTADGGRCTIIYDYDGEKVLRGFLDDLLEEEYDNHGVGSAYSEYLPEENKVRICFWKDALGDYDEKDFEIEMDKIRMEPYG